MANPFKGDKEKLAKMNFRQKVDYIWTYYKFGILVSILVIILAASFIHAQLIYNPDAMTLVLCDTYSEDPTTAYDEINLDFKNYLGLTDEDKDPISFDDTISFSADTGDQTSAIMLQKLMALVMSGGADLMVAPESGIVYYGAQQMFANLEEVLPADLFEELKAKDLLFETTYVPTDDEREDGIEEETFYCGIRLDGIDYFKDKGVLLENMAVGVVISGEHQSLGLQFIDMLFGRAAAIEE